MQLSAAGASAPCSVPGLVPFKQIEDLHPSFCSAPPPSFSLSFGLICSSSSPFPPHFSQPSFKDGQEPKQLRNFVTNLLATELHLLAFVCFLAKWTKGMDAP